MPVARKAVAVEKCNEIAWHDCNKKLKIVCFALKIVWVGLQKIKQWICLFLSCGKFLLKWNWISIKWKSTEKSWSLWGLQYMILSLYFAMRPILLENWNNVHGTLIDFPSDINSSYFVWHQWHIYSLHVEFFFSNIQNDIFPFFCSILLKFAFFQMLTYKLLYFSEF